MWIGVYININTMEGIARKTRKLGGWREERVWGKELLGGEETSKGVYEKVKTVIGKGEGVVE